MPGTGHMLLKQYYVSGISTQQHTAKQDHMLVHGLVYQLDTTKYQNSIVKRIQLN
jgi:hypothetical protein